jgi:hypothetical protein
MDQPKPFQEKEKCLPGPVEWCDPLAEVFDRGAREGVDALSPADRELFRIQEFILLYENGTLSGYLYNALANPADIHATIAAMRRHGLSRLADLLSEAAELFADYDPDPGTWGEVRRRYDPNGRIKELHYLIGALDDYGLADSTIVRPNIS